MPFRQLRANRIISFSLKAHLSDFDFFKRLPISAKASSDGSSRFFPRLPPSSPYFSSRCSKNWLCPFDRAACLFWISAARSPPASSVLSFLDFLADFCLALSSISTLASPASFASRWALFTRFCLLFSVSLVYLSNGSTSPLAIASSNICLKRTSSSRILLCMTSL